MSVPQAKSVPVTPEVVLLGRTKVRNRTAYLILGAVLLIGLALRLYGLNWDQGFMFHPDERAILMNVEGGLSLPMPIDFGQLIDPKTSPLNPHWFPYGSLPLYLLKLVGHVASLIQQTFASHDLRLVGRAVSAVFDVGTILLIYLVGLKTYGRRAGLLAAAFVSLAVTHIQLSHFYAVDVMLAFFIVLIIYLCIELAEHGRKREVILVGIVLGLALATKVSMAPILVTVAMAFLLNALRQISLRPDGDLQAIMVSSISRFLLCMLIGGVVFFIAEPFAILDREAFLASVTEQSEMVRRIRDYPYTRQYVDTPAFLYHIEQLTTWGLGAPLGIVVWAGLGFSVLAALIRRGRTDIILLSWVVPYFALTGAFEVKFLRYLLPMVPILCLMGARMLFTLRDWARHLGSRGTAMASVAIGVVVATTAFYALSYMNIYSLPHTAVRMSQWINSNVPKGSLILSEHWEEGIPNLGAFRSGTLNLYENDDERKLNQTIGQLAGADYVVFYSNRLYGTIPRLPQRYPMTSQYYRLLFTGQLGFELVHFEATYPQLLGVSFVDDTFGRPKLPTPAPLSEQKPSLITIDGGFADESFTVYDHPKVMIFKKVKSLSNQELRALFANVPPVTAPGLSAQPGLLLSPADAKANQEGGTWSEIFDPDGITNRLPVLSWLLFVEIISLATFPIGAVLFRRLADRGFILGKTLGILLVTYLSWLFAATHLLTYSRSTILLSLAILAVFSTYLFYRFRDDIVGFVRSRWRLLVLLEFVFLLAFFVFYLVRLSNPDLWHAWRGGEKPMDFAFLNAVVKTTYFPPYDPWFAGGYLNYYYFGQVIVATLIKAVGIVPAVGYNLMVPLLFALTLAGAFSIGYNLRLTGRPQGQLTGWSGSALLCGTLAALFVAVMGNIDGLLQIAESLARTANSPFQSSIPVLSGAVNAVAGLWKALIERQALPAFDFWRSSRMMPGTINITEFPYFTFLFADLHAHLIALPFTVLAIGTALNVVLPSQSVAGTGGASAVGDRNISLERGPLVLPMLARRLPWPLSSMASWLSSVALLPRFLPILALALVLGALRIINSWDFPTYFILAAFSIVVGELANRDRIGLATLFWSVVKLGLVFTLSTFLFRPFHDNYELFYTGVEPSKEKTLIEHYLAVHALFIFAVVSYLVLEIKGRFGRSGFIRMTMLVLRHWENLPHALMLRKRLVRRPDHRASAVVLGALVVLLIAASLALINLYLIAFLTIFLALAIPLALRELWMREANMAPRLFVLAMVGLAISLGIGVDFITIQGDVGRMNTVFKFYLQAWVLFGLAAAYGLVAVLSELSRRRAPARPSKALRGFGLTAGKTAWGIILFILLLSTSIYPLAATRVRVQDRFQQLPPTDDGMAFMKSAVYSDEKGRVELVHDYDAIAWMQANVKGSPVIVEAYTPLYRWGSRVSIYTGLPTIIGWDWHETQQRSPYRWMIEERQKDVREIYANGDSKSVLQLLKKYDAKYVYVGEIERLYFGQQVNAKFDQMLGKDLELVYRSQSVKIYQVKFDSVADSQVK